MIAGILTAAKVLSAALAAVGVYSIVYNLFLSPLKIYPGPWLYSISSLPIEVARVRGVHFKALEELHAKYGPIVRTRPNEISVIDGSGWAEIYGFRPGVAELRKADTGSRSNGAHSILTAPSRDQHRRARRMLAHAFSAQGMREQENRIQHYVDLLINGLAEQAGKAPVNAVEWFNWTTFDIIGDLAFGESFSCLESKRTHEWIYSILTSVKAVAIIWAAASWGLLPLIALFIPKRLIKARRANYLFSVDKIRQRTAFGKDRGDFWDHVLKHPLLPPGTDLTQPNMKGMTVTEMESNASDLVLAGSETTATLLSGLVFHILQHPHVHKRLTNEIRSTFPTEESITLASLLSSPPPSNTTKDDNDVDTSTPTTTTNSIPTTHLPYLTATLQETLRIYPPAPLLSYRLVAPTGATFNSHSLPPGTRIGIPMITAFTSPYNFTHPKSFIPERWLPVSQRHLPSDNIHPTPAATTTNSSAQDDEFANDNRHNVFQPFSYGPRNCIGMNLAQAEMRLVVARLLWRFDLAKPDMGDDAKEEEEWGRWVERQKIWILWHKGPLMVRVRERETGMEKREEGVEELR